MDKLFGQIRQSFQQKSTQAIKADFLIVLKKQIKDRSFREMIFHPLGFIYSKLYEFDNGESLRLHIWDKERFYQNPLMDIHNHFYTVNSLVLIGKIKNLLYQQNTSNDPNYAIYRGSYNAAGDRTLTKTNKSMFVFIQGEEVITQDKIYRITPIELHSSFVDPTNFTCTLVYTECPAKPTPIVLGPLHGQNEYTYPIKLVDTGIANDLLQKVLVNLQ